MVMNLFLIAIILLCLVGAGYFYTNMLGKQAIIEDEEDDLTLRFLTRAVSESFADTLKRNLKDMNLSRAEFEKQEKKKNELRAALKEAAYGNRDSKKTVKQYIIQLLTTTGSKMALNEANINNVIHFDSPASLKGREMFEILIYIYENGKGYDYGADGFKAILRDYGLADPIWREDGSFYYDFSIERLREVFDEVYATYTLSYEEKIDIIAERIFADYKGFGAADTLFDTNVDEIDCGVSGIPAESYDIKQGDFDKLEFSYESIWVMVSGINLRLSCLSFGTQEELIRVCQNIYKYNAPMALSRNAGNVVSTMKDGSRIVVARPPFCESWCFFSRKFDSAPSIAPSALLVDDGNEIPIMLMKWFIKGYRNIAVTGSQGTGKSTTLKSLIRFIPSDLNLRIQELAFELNLRYTYPDRNIVTFQETDSISAQDGLNLQKKTNGSVNIIGEVATAEAASWIIQTAMVASLFSMFTHHAKTAHDLVIAIRNNLLETGGYSNEKAAEEMVATVINIDMHMEKLKGHRFCSRITEIIPIRDRRYPSQLDDKLDDKAALIKDSMEYEHRITDRELFKTVNLCEWHNGRYVMVNMPTEETMIDMRSKMTAQEEEYFIKDMEWLRSKMEEYKAEAASKDGNNIQADENGFVPVA